MGLNTIRDIDDYRSFGIPIAQILSENVVLLYTYMFGGNRIESATNIVIIKFLRQVIPLLWDPHSLSFNLNCIFMRPTYLPNLEGILFKLRTL